MKATRLFLIAIVLLTMAASIALADIPQNVDFWAQRTSGGDLINWVILKNDPGNERPYFEDSTTLYVDNLYQPNWLKQLWFEAEYTQLPTQIPTLNLQAAGEITPYGYTVNGNNVTWYWTIFPQPQYERIFFPDASFFNMTNISKIEVGTLCTPEPGSLLAMGAGLVGLAGTLWRRRR